MRSAVVAGHLCLDLAPAFSGLPRLQPGTLLEVGALDVRVGGCVGNTGSDLAALGVPVRLAADVGSDQLGQLLLELLAQGGADIASVRRHPGVSTSYSLVVEAPGRDRSFWHHVGGNAVFDGSSVDPVGADVVHLGYPSALPALIAGDGHRAMVLLRRCRQHGVTTSLDLATVDLDAASAKDRWRSLLDSLLPLVDVITPSVDDLTPILGDPGGSDRDRARMLARQLLRSGAGVAMVTAGAAGFHLATAGMDRLRQAGRAFEGLAEGWALHDSWTPALAVLPTTTTGAGDAAAAGLLAALLDGRGPRASAGVAAASAAWRVGGHGKLPALDRLPHQEPSAAESQEVATSC